MNALSQFMGIVLDLFVGNQKLAQEPKEPVDPRQQTWPDIHLVRYHRKSVNHSGKGHTGQDGDPING